MTCVYQIFKSSITVELPIKTNMSRKENVQKPCWDGAGAHPRRAGQGSLPRQRGLARDLPQSYHRGSADY